MAFIRGFLIGSALGAAFPGLLAGLFLAFPIFMIATALLVGGAPSVFQFFGHPAIALLAIGAGVVGVLRTIRWASYRHPLPSLLLFTAIYAVFYGAIAHGISNGDWIWAAVIGALAGGYVYRKASVALGLRKAALSPTIAP